MAAVAARRILGLRPGCLLFAGLHEHKWRSAADAGVIADRPGFGRAGGVAPGSGLRPGVPRPSWHVLLRQDYYRKPIVTQTAFLSGTRIAYRSLRDTRGTLRRTRDVKFHPGPDPGTGRHRLLLLRAMESGVTARIWPVGLLSPRGPTRASPSAASRCWGDWTTLSRCSPNSRSGRLR